MPTLLLWGEADAEAFRTLLTNAEVEIIDRSRHLPQLERPDDFHDSFPKSFCD